MSGTVPPTEAVPELEIGDGWTAKSGSFSIVFVDDAGVLIQATSDMSRQRPLTSPQWYVWPDLLAVDDANHRVFYVASDRTASEAGARQHVGVFDLMTGGCQQFDWVPAGLQLQWLLEYLHGRRAVAGHLATPVQQKVAWADYVTALLLVNCESWTSNVHRLPVGLWSPLLVGPDEQHLIYRGNRSLAVVSGRGEMVSTMEEAEQPDGVSFFRGCTHVLLGGRPLRKWAITDGSVSDFLEEAHQPFWSDIHERLWFLHPSTDLLSCDVGGQDQNLVARIKGDWDPVLFSNTAAIAPSREQRFLVVRLAGKRPITDAGRLDAIRKRVGEAAFDSCPAYAQDHVEVRVVVDVIGRTITRLGLSGLATARVIGTSAQVQR